MTIIVGGSVVINTGSSTSVEDVPIMYFDIASNPSLALTSTPQMVSGWTKIVPAVGADITDGRTTFNESGILQVSLERIYQNDDQDPNDVVEVTIEVRKNGVTLFTRSSTISSATRADEPAIASFTSNGIRDINSSDYFEVYVSGTDGDVNPASTILKSIRMIGNLIHNPL